MIRCLRALHNRPEINRAWLRWSRSSGSTPLPFHLLFDRRGLRQSQRSRSKPRSACGQKWMSSAPITRHRTVPAFSDLVRAHSDALAYLRGGSVSFAGRRAGDPAQIVAASDRVCLLLKWQPHFDDLQTIVCHALAWERKLLTRAD
jgi:hypothetical protein